MQTEALVILFLQMPKWHRGTCKDCGTRDDEGGGISGSGYCLACAEVRRIEANQQLIDHRGPYFDHWRARTLAAFGVTTESQKAS